MPRFRNRVPGELRTFGEFLRDYREESSFSERADVRASQRTFGDFNEWLSKQPFEVDDVRVKSQSSFTRPLLASSAAAHEKLGPPIIGGPEAEGRNAADPMFEPRRDNRVARNLRIAGKAAAADGRMYNPSSGLKTIYGTYFDPFVHTRYQSVTHLRSMKRREVLFARGRIGKRAPRSNRALKWR